MQSGKGSSEASLTNLRARNEAGQVAGAFNDMVGQLARDRDRLVQSERVAARREMARRFTREIKESLFPLHVAAEDLVHAREETSERFDEIFFESMTSLRAELVRLRGVAARFGQFATMPAPRKALMYVNEAARAAMSALEPCFRAPGRPPVTPEVHLGESDPVIHADPDLLRVALQNLLLDCMDAMPSGGTLAIRTKEKDGAVRIEISAKGAALGAQECSRLFTPGSSNPEGMTGLGLATAQAAVIDLGGEISAESAPDGATFRLEFRAAPAGVKPPMPPPDPVNHPRQLTAGTPQLPPAEVERPTEEAATPVEEPATPPAADGD